jgi:putative hydrolase of the HAD superfamily
MLERFCQRSAENVILHPGALDTLAELRDAGFITGIITNGIEQLQLSKIQRLKLDEEVDHVVVSAQARAHKPRKEVFDLALERAAVKPAQAWQIGDHATNDVAGAIRAGMSGVFFDPEGTRRATAFSKLEVEPTHVISSLPQVIQLLS